MHTLKFEIKGYLFTTARYFFRIVDWSVAGGTEINPRLVKRSLSTSDIIFFQQHDGFDFI